MKKPISRAITKPGARNLFELPVQLTSGTFSVVEVAADTKDEAERMAKQHGYQLHKAGHVDVVRPAGTTGPAALAWGAIAVTLSTFPAWWPKVAAFIGWAG